MNLFDDADFDFGDNALSDVEREKIKVLEQIKKYSDLAIDNVKYQEGEDYKCNFKILSKFISAMYDLNMLEEEQCLSEEEVSEHLKTIDLLTSDMDFNAIDKLDTLFKQQCNVEEGDEYGGHCCDGRDESRDDNKRDFRKPGTNSDGDDGSLDF